MNIQFWWLYNQLYQVTRRLYTLAAWHVELFRCHVNLLGPLTGVGWINCCCNGYIILHNLLRNTQIQCTPQAPPHPLASARWFAANRKQRVLFTHRQAGPAPQHPWRFLLCQWPRPCLQQEAVAGGRSLLHCLLPFRGLQVGNILVLYPAVLAVPGVVLVFPALFVPVSLLTLFWWVPLKHFVVHSA